jgi:hypothetical protein
MSTVTLTAPQVAAMHPDEGSRLFGSRWAGLVTWARSLLCSRCHWYCRSGADCDLNLTLAADGIAPEQFDNIPPIDWGQAS